MKTGVIFGPVYRKSIVVDRMDNNWKRVRVRMISSLDRFHDAEGLGVRFCQLY